MSAVVTVPEAQLLRAVQAVFQRSDASWLASRLRRADAQPPALIGATAMQLLQQTLRRGVVGALVRRGAWRSRKALGPVKRGRLWRLRPELELRFTASSYALCRWLAGGSTSPPPPAKSVADGVLHYLAADALITAGQPIDALGASPMVALGFPDRMLPERVEWKAWLDDPSGPIVLEALQDDLCKRWIRLEQSKGGIVDASELVQLGQAQRDVLSAYLDSIDEADRRDLAGFLVAAGARLVHRSAQSWIAGLSPNAGTLSERADATRLSAAFLEALGRLAQWRREWAMVRFIDDGYERAQLHLDAWDVLGQAGFERAERLADELASLRELTS